MKRPYSQQGQGLQLRVRKWIHLSVQAAPAIVKSAVMGGVLFSCFESLEVVLQDQWRDLGSGVKESQIGVPSLIALLAGGTSGSVHGVVHTTWDRLGARLFPLPTSTLGAAPSFRSLLCGTAIAHSLVHGLLFGSYEATKRLSLVLIGLNTEHDTSRVEGESMSIYVPFSVYISLIQLF